MVLANELLRRRVPCRMIDKRSGPTETSRSFTLHAKTMEMFEHMGLAHRFLEDGLSYNYRDVIDVPGGLKPLPGPACGDRVVNVALSNNCRLYDLIRTGRLSLVIVEDAGATGDRARTLYRRISGQYGHIIRSMIMSNRSLEGLRNAGLVTDAKGEFAECYGKIDSGQLLLIRPDGYIGFRCHTDEEEQFFDYLDTWFKVQ